VVGLLAYLRGGRAAVEGNEAVSDGLFVDCGQVVRLAHKRNNNTVQVGLFTNITHNFNRFSPRWPR
jgi:hypothetical protein